MKITTNGLNIKRSKTKEVKQKKRTANELNNK